MVVNQEKFMNAVAGMLTTEFAAKAPRDTSRLAQSFFGTLKIEGTTIRYNLPKYAQAVMEGSAPHDITVKDKKILAVPINKWKGKTPNAYGTGKFPMLSKNGKFVLLGKKVRHPGNRPNPFMKDVLHRKLPEIIKKAIEIANEG